METEVRKEVEEASDKAKTDPELPLDELYKHIISQPPSDMKIRGCDVLTHMPTK